MSCKPTGRWPLTPFPFPPHPFPTAHIPDPVANTGLLLASFYNAGPLCLDIEKAITGPQRRADGHVLDPGLRLGAYLLLVHGCF